MGCSSSLAVKNQKNDKAVKGKNITKDQANQAHERKEISNQVVEQNNLIITDLREDEATKYHPGKISNDKKKETSSTFQTMSMKVELPPARDINAKNNSSQMSMCSRGHSDTNNNGSSMQPDRTMNPAEGVPEEDEFDLASQPLSRLDMVKNRSHATKETLDFVYKTSTRIAPPAGSNAHVPGTSPSYHQVIPSGNRMTNRRGSGVPPPPRELKSSDFLARRAAGEKINMAEENEEEDAH